MKADDGYRDAKNLLGQVLIDEKKYPEAITVLEPLTKDQAYAFPHLAWGNLGWGAGAERPGRPGHQSR